MKQIIFDKGRAFYQFALGKIGFKFEDDVNSNLVKMINMKMIERFRYEVKERSPYRKIGI